MGLSSIEHSVLWAKHWGCYDQTQPHRQRLLGSLGPLATIDAVGLSEMWLMAVQCLGGRSLGDRFLEGVAKIGSSRGKKVTSVFSLSDYTLIEYKAPEV